MENSRRSLALEVLAIEDELVGVLEDPEGGPGSGVLVETA
jgi:hypothetical protein